jgi:hypothetical protein
VALDEFSNRQGSLACLAAIDRLELSGGLGAAGGVD